MKLTETSTVLVAFLLVTAGCLVGFAGATTVMDDGSTLGGTNGTEQIEVAATGTAEGEANRVYVRVHVVETAETAARARRQLAANSSKLREALESVDVPADNVTTLAYDIRYDRDPDLGADGPYRASQEFRVTTTGVDRAGRVIDAATIRGDAQVDGVRFGFSRERYRTLKERALQDAMGAARDQATATAESEGLRLAGVDRVQTGGTMDVEPVGGRGSFLTSGGGSPPTDLAAGSRTVQVRVVVTYNATG